MATSTSKARKGTSKAKATGPAAGRKARTATAVGTPRMSGKARTAAAKRVVALRHGRGGSQANPKGMSWAQCAAAVPGVGGPAHARRLYNEVQGAGAHHGLLPGKGGRRPVPAAPVRKARKGKATAAK